MTYRDYREQVIVTLTKHLNHCKGLLSAGIYGKYIVDIDEVERIIDALTFAIESIKVDLEYDLAHEKAESGEEEND